MVSKAVEKYWERNQAVVAGEMSTVELACWTAVMNVIGYGLLALFWICAA